MLPSPSDDSVGDLSSWFSKLNTLPVAAPVYASDRTSRCAPQDSGSGWIRCSFPVGLFHSLLHAGLSRRTVCPTCYTDEAGQPMGTPSDHAASLNAARADTSFFGHPRGLATLFFTEMWERFSYYGMRAILIYSLPAPIARGGLGFTDSKAGAVYGLYTGMVYLMC